MDEIDSIDDVWRRFKSSGDPGAREQLILRYAPLVKYVAGRVRSGLPREVDQADLLSEGVIGLMDAIDKFDLERGLQFQTYAVTRIRGAIIDGLRASDWTPRAVRESIRDVNQAQASLEHRLGRVPRDDEVAAELGVAVQKLRKIYREASHSTVVHLEADGVGADSLPDISVDPFEGSDLPEGFMQAVHELAERDRIVIALYYWDRLTLAEIGQVLGVTESRVSQLHTRATTMLRGKLTNHVAG